MKKLTYLKQAAALTAIVCALSACSKNVEGPVEPTDKGVVKANSIIGTNSIDSTRGIIGTNGIIGGGK